MSVEERAKFTGHEDAYNIVYRSFSRNIHSTDYVEHSLNFIPEIKDEYLEARDIASMYTAHFASGGIAEFANFVFQCGFEREINDIGFEKLKIKSS